MSLLQEGIIFLGYVIICCSLTKSRWSRKAAVCTVGVVLTGIILLQAALLLAGCDVTLVLTLLPVTAYLPFSVSLYIISDFGVTQSTVACAFGLLCVYMLRVVKKIMVMHLGTRLWYPYNDLLISLLLLLAAGLFVFVSFRVLREPFISCFEERKGNWLLIFFPILMSFLLLSYFRNSTVSDIVLVLLLLTGVSVFVIVIRVVTSQAALSRMERAEQEMKEQMNRQFQEYDDVCKKVEAGRIYRHDMRHHLLVMEGLADQNDLNGIHGYIENLKGRLLDTEHEVYCVNSTVNAVLSACIRQAKEAGCLVAVKTRLPEKIPFDEMDVCMILANALENAVNACQKLREEQERKIDMKVELRDEYKLIVSIRNPVDMPVPINEDGVPNPSGLPGHGIGLKSIRVIAEKYNGFLQCECEKNVFMFQAALFGERQKESVPAPGKKGSWKKLASSAGLSAIAVVIFTGYAAVTASAHTGTYGKTLQVYGRFVGAGWGDTSFHADIPVVQQTGTQIDVSSPEPEDTEIPPDTEDADTHARNSGGSTEIQLPLSGTGDTQALQPGAGDIQAPSGTGDMQPPSADDGKTDLSGGIAEMNRQIEQFVQEARDRFIWYVARKYDGYVQSDITWRTVQNDEARLTIRMINTLNAGGSGEFSRYFILDKKTGDVLKLEDLFLKGSDYVDVISADVLRQMTWRQENGQGRYFIPGSIFSESSWFREIAADQNFYINDQNKLVIVFDEYEVAPGFMGMPEFVIETDVLREILKQPSCIS